MLVSRQRTECIFFVSAGAAGRHNRTGQCHITDIAPNSAHGTDASTGSQLPGLDLSRESFHSSSCLRATSSPGDPYGQETRRRQESNSGAIVTTQTRFDF